MPDMDRKDPGRRHVTGREESKSIWQAEAIHSCSTPFGVDSLQQMGQSQTRQSADADRSAMCYCNYDITEQNTMSADTEQVDFLHKIRTRTGSLKAGRFFLHFLELQISMGLGAFVCYLVVRLISSSPSYTTIYRPGTLLFALGDIFFLVIPVVAWMTVRGHGWRYSLEIAVAMIVPVAAIIVLGQLSRYAYLLWLITAGYPAMTLGMLVYMLYRHDHFLGWESRA
jgi:hypothetical protein